MAGSQVRPLRWTVLATHVPAGGSLGGIVRYTTEILRALAERDDVIVSAVTTRSAAATVAAMIGSADRVQTVPDLPAPVLSIAERWLPLPAAARRSGSGEGPDVIHGIKHLLPARTRAFRVLTVHDMLLLDRPQDFPIAKRLMLPRSYRASLADADLLLCVSEATRQRVLAYLPDAAARAQVVHLATSQSLREAHPDPVTALAGRRFAMVVGDSSPRKNLTTVITAWTRQHSTDAVLAIAGPPNWGETVLGAAYAQAVESGAVVPLGQVTDGQLRWAYENAALVLCPSLDEGFGLPAAEAMAFGAPTLISDAAALVEVAAGRAVAVLAPLAVEDWARAISAVLRAPSPPAVPVLDSRTWAQVAQDTVTAVNRAVQDRNTGGGVS
jgi:glycosyltransferase involved in cell wall biosynthesis